MIELVVVLAVIALAAAGFTGWMIAVRGATRSRRATASSLADADHRATAAETRASDLAHGAQQREIELGGLRDQNASARQEIGELRSLLAVAKQSVARHDELARAAQRAVIDANAAQAALRAELGIVQERLAQRESGHAREGRAVAEVQRVLAPLIERERLANKLAHLDIGRGTRGELPRLIDSIAHLGGFSTVVLSDEAGLPLAVN